MVFLRTGKTLKTAVVALLVAATALPVFSMRGFSAEDPALENPLLANDPELAQVVSEVEQQERQNAEDSKRQVETDVAKIRDSGGDDSAIYRELLIRAGREKLIETAFVLSAVDELPPEKSALISIFDYFEGRFPGLEEKAEKYKTVLRDSYSSIEARQHARFEMAQLLVYNAILIEGREKQRTELLEKVKKVKLDPNSEDAIKIVSLTQSIDEAYAVHPLLHLLKLNPAGPGESEEKIAIKGPELFFQWARSGESLKDLLIGMYESKRFSQIEMAQFAEQAMLNWLPAWTMLVRKLDVDIQLFRMKDFFRHPELRGLALQYSGWSSLDEKMFALDSRNEKRFGYAVTAVESLAFIVSASYGAAASVVNGLGGMLERVWDKTIVTAGSFVGFNGYESVCLVRSRNIYKPVLVGVANAITGSLLRVRLARFLKELPAASSRLAAGIGSMSIRSLMSWQTLLRLPALTGAAASAFLATHKKEVALAALNTLGGELALITVSLKTRNKGFVALLKDKNFRRDASLEFLNDMVLGFYTAQGKGYVESAFAIGSVVAVSSVVAQMGTIGRVDWSRVSYDFAFSVSLSYWKLARVFGPLSEKARMVIQNRFDRLVSSRAIVSGATKQIYNMMEHAAQTSTGVAIMMLSNFIGSGTYVLMGVTLEEKKDSYAVPPMRRREENPASP
jgi:hypothetical protein